MATARTETEQFPRLTHTHTRTHTHTAVLTKRRLIDVICETEYLYTEYSRQKEQRKRNWQCIVAASRPRLNHRCMMCRVVPTRRWRKEGRERRKKTEKITLSQRPREGDLALRAAEKYICKCKWSSHSGREAGILRSQRPRGGRVEIYI